jgi:hypothetical protein
MRRHHLAWAVGGAIVGLLVVSTAATTLPRALGQGDGAVPAASTTRAACRTTAVLRVTTASSFAPVLARLGRSLAEGPDCVRLAVTAMDGRRAAQQLTTLRTDVWIPDDASWASYAPAGVLAAKGQAGAGTVVATSPVYMVTDPATARRVTDAGGSWYGLTELLTHDPGVRLAVRAPGGSGDGLVGAGALGEAVWLRSGMDASSMAMITTVQRTRTVSGSAPALPMQAGEVGLVPEYALLPRLGTDARDVMVLSGNDRTAMLRYAWQPTAVAAGNPQRQAALYRLLMTLTGAESSPALAAAELRRPEATPPPPGAPTERLPQLASAAFGVIAPHHADHILATWYPEERRADLLLVVDVSGSMREAAPGTRTSKISLVRQGVLSVANLLPPDARLGLWKFGYRLDPPHDYQVLLPPTALGSGQRRGLRAAVGKLQAQNSGTALYDTILDAYRSAQAAYRPGVPNQVLFFTDGHEQDDPDAISPAVLSQRLRAVADPRRPVELAIVVFGKEADAAFLKTVLAPVNGYLEPVASGDQVGGMFVHVAVGGLRTR